MSALRGGHSIIAYCAEARVRRDYPLRTIRAMVSEALAALEREFAVLYSPIGRPSISPEKLLRAMLLKAFYSIRSERLLMERLEYDLLFGWFVGIDVDDAAWDHSRADRPTAITFGADKALRRRRLRQRTALDERDTARCAEHQRPQLND